MIAFDRSVIGYADRVLLARDITPDYAAKVRYSLRTFCGFLGCDPGVDGLDAGPVNEFLEHLQQLGKRPDTVAGYRRAILVVWNQAYQDRLNDNPPLRVRKIRTPREPVEAFCHESLRSLLQHAASLVGYFPNGARRADFWGGTIHAAYSTGLRRGDLLRLRWDQIARDGTATVRQHKTGYAVCVRVSPEALSCMARMRVDERALPWPYHPNALSRQFRRLVAAAGIVGQFRWLRRSAGSYAESVEPGGGSRALGHRSPHIFEAFYRDARIAPEKPTTPPPIY